MAVACWVLLAEIWIQLTIWTMMGVGIVFFGAGIVACRVGKTRFKWTWLPLCMLVLGVSVGFMQGALSSALIAALYTSIPYSIGLDIAAGMGIGQAIIIVYLQLGRADFIHR